MKILLVDDNTDDRTMLRRVLEAHGHGVVEAVNGQEGLRMASAHSPDLIISDVLMPVMDGFQFLRNLRELSSVPFVFYSAIYDGNRDKQLAASLGANGYLVKPKDPVELMEEIGRIARAGIKKSSGVVEDDSEYLKRYSQVVASKLEEKVRELEETLAERKRVEQALLEKQQRLSDVTVELSLAEERERRRIATELHDTIGQDLALARIKLGTIAKSHLRDEEAGIIDTTREMLGGMIQRVRHLTHMISPPILESGGLEAALKWLGRQMEADYGLRVAFVDDMSEKPLTEEIRSVLYYAVRELLINVVKHSGTDAARITVGREGARIVITVEDDGGGFDPAAIEQSLTRERGGFGLFNVRRRIIHLGGAFEVKSSPGVGTCVTIGMQVKG
jgi:signal transduction histidine kinase